MASNNRRPDRVAEAIRVEVATFLSQDVKDPRIVGLVTVTGVGFFDFLHEARGQAPNGFELHPVVSFVVDETIAPQRQ